MDENTSTNQDDTQNQFLADDAVPVCPTCLEPCSPLDYYCPHCGSNETLNPLASYMPFVDIRFRVGMIGKLWRKTWHRRTPLLERVCYIGLFLLFVPLILLVGLPFVIYDAIKKRKNTDRTES
jgi:hypothetical protein